MEFLTWYTDVQAVVKVAVCRCREGGGVPSGSIVVADSVVVCAATAAVVARVVAFLCFFLVRCRGVMAMTAVVFGIFFGEAILLIPCAFPSMTNSYWL